MWGFKSHFDWYCRRSSLVFSNFRCAELDFTSWCFPEQHKILFSSFCGLVLADREDIAKNILSEDDVCQQKKLSKKTHKSLNMKEWNDSLPSVMFTGNVAKVSSSLLLPDEVVL